MGYHPKIIDLLDSPESASYALDANLVHGDIRPFALPRILQQNTKDHVVPIKEGYLEFDRHTTISRSNSETMDLLYRSDGVVMQVATPTEALQGEWVDLGVTCPKLPPMFVYHVAGGACGGVYTAIRYRYMTRHGHVSAPSPATALAQVDERQPVTISNFEVPPPHVTSIIIERIFVAHRTGLEGRQMSENSWNVAAVLPATTTSIDLLLMGFNAGYALPEELDRAFVPPVTLSGCIVTKQDQLVGFYENELHFSLAGYHNVFSEDNVIVLDDEIVSIVEYGDTLYILTTGYPVVLSGKIVADQLQVDWRKFSEFFPCVAVESIAITDNGVIYASENCVAALSGSSARNITAGILTRPQYKALNPRGSKAVFYEGKYYLYNGMTLYEFSMQVNKQLNMVVLELGHMVDISFIKPTCLTTSMEQGFLFVENGNLYVWEPDNIENSYGKYLWRSTLIRSGDTRRLTAVKITFSRINTTDTATFRIYRSDNDNIYLLHEVTVNRDIIVRLPRYHYVEYYFEVEGTGAIKTVSLGESIYELGKV